MRYLLRIFALGGVLALLAVSAAIFQTMVSHFGPANSLDSLLTANRFLLVLGVDQPALRVERALNEFPPDAHLLLIGPKSDPFIGQTHLMLVYLSYPRKLSALFCSSPGHGEIIGPPDPAPVDGILFFATKVVNPDRNYVSIGNKLTITRQKSISPWQSYCQ